MRTIWRIRTSEFTTIEAHDWRTIRADAFNDDRWVCGHEATSVIEHRRRWETL